jgi:hypothetical protein
MSIVSTLEEKLGGLIRAKPVRKDKGEAYWKLDGYYEKTAIMRQGMFEILVQYGYYKVSDY